MAGMGLVLGVPLRAEKPVGFTVVGFGLGVLSLDFGIGDCKCCGVVGTSAKSKKSKSKSKRIRHASLF